MISYQLYSSRNFGAPADAVRRVAELGYPAVEGYGALFADAAARDALAAALSETGTAMPTAHVGLATLEAEPDLAATLAGMGVEAVYIPHVAPSERPSDPDGWRAFADRVALAGEGLRAQGVRVGWHNHDFEFAPLPDGSVPMDHMLAAELDWQFDLAWAVRAGADPMGWIERHGDRITAVHVKDIAPAGEKADEDGWADPGTGRMGWNALVPALSRAGAVRHWVMEHDNPSDDMRFARAGLAMARAEGLA
ncbi:sugar phosphate isomerase/epimerase family protein [Jannaschia formosa]|uniref:sugar phosphate isomerase/epimerase family protein n=1 Tax=Jannaschia formosa TaxID=2259592 RepID=UPI000E1BAFEA|nr:sugar phosphate isomerase/epimerase [Jannaschia formosa]TFL16313.1 sugar phosphate isomerase/epimerase [Jannaschia formosa]